jgi:hypothetical protein
MSASAQAPTRPSLPLQLLAETFAVCRLEPGAAVPEWAANSRAFLTVTRTPAELSITAEQRVVPSEARCERDYRMLRVEGPLPFDLVGVFASIVGPLAGAGISIFPIATFDTDHVLVKAADLERAVVALERAGHRVTRPGGTG